jgi:transcriptional regulator with XRE-family HTH domain
VKILESVGARLAHARREMGVREGREVTRAELAAAVDVAPSTVTQWEKGKKQPREEVLGRAAAFLGVSPMWLRYGNGTESGRVSEPAPTSAFSQAVRRWEKRVELELIEMGATDAEVSGFGASVRGNPLLVAAFAGTDAGTLTGEEIAQLFQSAAESYKAIAGMLIAARRRTNGGAEARPSAAEVADFLNKELAASREHDAQTAKEAVAAPLQAKGSKGPRRGA